MYKIQPQNPYAINITARKFSLLVVIVAFVLGVVSLSQTAVKASKVICNSFANQEAAQNLFNLDKSKYKALDRDGDGIACETLLLNK